MGSTRRLVIAGAVGLAAMAITAGTLVHGGDAPTTARALDSDVSLTAPAESPSTTVALPTPEPESTEPAPQPPSRPAGAPAPADPAPAAVEPPAREVQLPLNPVPLPDRNGPAITNIRMAGCTIQADVGDPAGVAIVTLSWTGVAEPNFPDEWIVEPGSSRMHLVDGTVYQGSRPYPYAGQTYTVTAVDRTLVGNRASASMAWNVHGYPC